MLENFMHANINPKSLDLLIENNCLVLKYLCLNTSDRAADIILNNINKIDNLEDGLIMNLCRNYNDKIVNYLLDNFNFLYNNRRYIYFLSLNTNERIIKKICLLLNDLTLSHFLSKLYKNSSNIELLLYSIKNNEIKNYFFHHLYSNSNDKILDIILKNYDFEYNNLWINLCNNLSINPYINNQINKTINELNDYCFQSLCLNTNDRVFNIIFKFLDEDERRLKLCLIKLCSNTNDRALYIISNNIRKINYEMLFVLCSNTNDYALEILFEFIFRIENPYGYYYIFKELIKNNNIKIIEFIKDNIKIIKSLDPYFYTHILRCYNIFTYDYENMKQKRTMMINTNELNKFYIQ